MKFRHDIEEGMLIPQQWCAWGAILSRGRNIGSYFMLQLPSYKLIDSYWEDGAKMWGKLTFMKILFDGHNEKYRLDYLPVWDKPYVQR